MRRLSEFSAQELATVNYLLCDIDDTITTDGRLTAEAFGAMERLQTAGLSIIPITGRPAGWCDHFARMWPIDAIVGENGAFYFRYHHDTKVFHKQFFNDAETRQENRAQINRVAQNILQAVPGCALASDQLYREADIAIDFCEDVKPLSATDIQKIVRMMEEQGLTAKVSSIHVNGWIGSYDKLTMTKRLMAEVYECDIETEKNSFVFIGDSPNDQPMFQFFPNSVGVANIHHFEKDLIHKPAYVTELEAGSGFVELADALISARA